jgi:hypothetical protein
MEPKPTIYRGVDYLVSPCHEIPMVAMKGNLRYDHLP